MSRYKNGRRVSLRDELSDAVSENLPEGDEIDSFCKSPAYEKLLDECMEVILRHLDAGKEEVLE